MVRSFLLSSLLLVFIAIPATVFGADTPCTDAIMSCRCTDDEGNQTSSNSSSNNTDTLCYNHCRETRGVSYEFFCGDAVIPAASGGLSGIFEETLSAVSDLVTENEEPTIPALNVPIPGLDLSGSVQFDDQGNIETNMIGLYVNAVFSYAIVLASILGVLMFTLAGFQYMTAGGDKGAVSKAKDRMQNTIFGIIILMATYSIAFMIDPRTTRFNSLSLKNIAAIEYFPPEGEDDHITPNLGLDGSAEALSGDHVIPTATNMMLDEDALVALQSAAKDFYTLTGKNIVVTSAKRDLQKQAELFYNNCLRTGGVCSPDTCNPASDGVIKKTGSRFEMIGELQGQTNSSSIVSTLVRNAEYGNCPHTSAVALDAWCDDGGSNYRHNPACQETLIQTMINHGFCRLTSEVWHFELESKAVSQRCLQSNNSISYTVRAGPFTPSISNCMRWDFKNHVCVTPK